LQISIERTNTKKHLTFAQIQTALKIAVNTRLLLKDKLEGIGWFTAESLSRITKQHPEHEFIFLFDRPFDASFIFSSNITPLVLPPAARHPFLYYIWYEYMLPGALQKSGADLFLSTDGLLSLSSNVPSVVVIHDLNFEHYPQDLRWILSKYYRYYLPRFAAHAARIATVSEFSRKDICNLYGITEEKIDVVYNGAGEQFIPLSKPEQALVKAQFAGGNDYFLYVGALHPRKNLANLFKAFDHFKENDNKGMKLLVVGARYWWTDSIKNAYENLRYREDVLFTGRLSSADLRNVMASAFALTYVSYFEGFGIPLVEAFYCDTPVITSNITSMPEVAGDAALLVDPFNHLSISDAMLRLVKDPALRNQLIEKGRLRRTSFSWQKTSEKLWATCEKVIEMGGLRK
jgi:glycosyltransferase involved in cell wall biosynthesis